MKDNDLEVREQKLARAVITEELVTLTGDMLLGVVLRQLIFWSTRTNDVDKYLKEERKRVAATSEDEAAKIDELMSNGWIYKTAAELKHEIMFTGGDSTMAKLLSRLSETPWVQRRRNPRHAWDKTWQYRVDLVRIEKDLAKIGYSLATVMGEDYPFVTAENTISINEKSETRNDKAIPEITSETTSKKIGADAPAKKPRTQDPRSQHPIIQAIREITKRNPAKVQYDPIISAVGDRPVDKKLLQECFDAWVIKGWNPSNFSWVTDWYAKGGPQGYGHEPPPPKIVLVKERYKNPYTGEIEEHTVAKRE